MPGSISFVNSQTAWPDKLVCQTDINGEPCGGRSFQVKRAKDGDHFVTCLECDETFPLEQVIAAPVTED